MNLDNYYVFENRRFLIGKRRFCIENRRFTNKKSTIFEC